MYILINMTERKKIRNCTWCNKLFLGNRNTCSKKCLSELRSYNITGDKNPMYGSERYGELNPNWRNGAKFQIYPKQFNKKLKHIIKLRDNYQCVICGKSNEDCINKNGVCYGLQVHHIDYNKKNNNIDNLITLCNKCHTKTNFNREKWIIFFNEQ